MNYKKIIKAIYIYNKDTLNTNEKKFNDLDILGKIKLKYKYFEDNYR